MATRLVTVRTLGGSSHTVDLCHPTDSAGPTIAALRLKLHEEGHRGLRGCKLFFNGSSLSDGHVVPHLPQGAFLVAVPVLIGGSTRQARAVKKQEATSASPHARTGLASPPSRSPFKKATLLSNPPDAEDLDTLLVGYAIRPSPVKRKRTDKAQRTTETEGGGFVIGRAEDTVTGAVGIGEASDGSGSRAETRSPCGSQTPLCLGQGNKRHRKAGDKPSSLQPLTSQSVGETPIPLKASRGRKTPGLQKSKGAKAILPEDTDSRPPASREEEERAIAQLPLSHHLERLKMILASLSEVLEFLSSQHVTPTWHAVSAILGQSETQSANRTCQGKEAALPLSISPISLEDVRMLASIAPSLLTLRDRDRPHDGDLINAISLRKGADGGANGCIDGSRGSGCADADGMIQGWPAQLIDRAPRSFSDGRSKDVADGESDLASSSLTLALNDPGR